MRRKYAIVGGGIAGGILAKHLLRQGQEVTLIEAGMTVPMRDPAQWLHHVTTGETPYDGCADLQDSVQNEGPQDLVLKGSRLFVRGGSTVHWDGCCPRLAPEDFEKASRCGFGMDWPFGYDLLEPFYERAEHLIGVSADYRHGRVKRRNPLPFPPLKAGRIDLQFAEACERLGWQSERIPVARNVQPLDGRVPCQNTGTCAYCPVGGRFTGDLLFDQMDHERSFSYVRGAARRVLMNDAHLAEGVEITDLVTGDTRSVFADRVIIAAGAIESAKLLMASRARDWTAGLGNHSGHLGRHLTAHPLLKLWVGRDVNSERLRPEHFFPTWCSREFDGPEHQQQGKMILFPFGGPTVDLARMIAEGRSPEEVRAATQGPAELMLAGLLEMRESEASRIELAPGTTALGLPRTRIHFEWTRDSIAHVSTHRVRMERVAREMGWQPLRFQIDQSPVVPEGRFAVRGDHVTGLCRMSTRASDGVVDPDLRIHGVDNVWVCSNAVFPSPGAANPTLTLAALAIRLGDRLTS